MRGDSLRDFYAKTLALVGLGMLAGTGALVDYWPSGIDLPATTSVLGQAPAARALSLRGSTEVVFLPAGKPRPVRAPRPVTPPPQATPEVTATFAVTSGPIAFSANHIVVLSAPRDLPSSVLAEAAPAYPVLYHADDVTPLPDQVPEVASTLVAIPRGDGLFVGVMKKTGATIAKGGAKTGASILGAMRALGGAVWRALPI